MELSYETIRPVSFDTFCLLRTSVISAAWLLEHGRLVRRLWAHDARTYASRLYLAQQEYYL